MTQLRQQKDQLEQLDIRTKIVTFDSDVLGRQYAAGTAMPWPLLLDSDRRLYRAYGFLTGSWWELSRPAAIWKYLKVIWAGNPPGKPGKDLRQLGGDVLIDPQGIVRMQHISTSPFDRPTVKSILRRVADQ